MKLITGLPQLFELPITKLLTWCICWGFRHSEEPQATWNPVKQFHIDTTHWIPRHLRWLWMTIYTVQSNWCDIYNDDWMVTQ